VPVPGRGGKRGALSVLVAPGGEPPPGQRDFLVEVARWVARRLSSTGSTGLSPDLLRALETGPEGGAGTAERGADVPSVTVTWDLRTGEMSADRPLEEVLDGVDPTVAEHGIEAWVGLIHPDDVPRVVASVDEGVRLRGGYEADYRLRRADGHYRWVQVNARTVLDAEGSPAEVRATVWDSAETHVAADLVGRALRHMDDGFLSLDGVGRIVFLNTAAERLLGPAREVIGEPLWDLPSVRAVPGLGERCRHATTAGEPTGFDVAWPGGDRWYHLRLVPVPDGLTLYITDSTEKHLREADREAAERAAGARAILVGKLTRMLAEAVTAPDVVTAVAESVLPPFRAAGLMVMSLEGDRLAVVGSVGYSRAFQDRLHGLPLRAETPIAAVVHTRTALFLSSKEEYAGRFRDSEQLLAASGKESWAFMPLTVSGRPIGVAVISFDRPHRLNEDERTLLTAVSGLIAQSLDRAGLYDEATTRARTLQRGLLPRALPRLSGITAAARYLPAAQGADVGGDWYDLIPLSADRVALVIGDVMGHGMAEAAAMGRLRTAARTLSELDQPPEEILAHLHGIVAEMNEDFFVTCLYGIYDPVARRLSYASGGHLPPVVVLADGAEAFSAPDPDPPLGVAVPPFETVELDLPDGSLVALCTDGLVESPTRDIGSGIGQLADTLRATVTGLRSDCLQDVCDQLTESMLPVHGRRGDDAALLLVRANGLPARNVARWLLPEGPVAAGAARRHVRDQLAVWELGEDLVMTTELLASELVGNVVRHAKGPIQLRLLRSANLTCEVSDTSPTTPHIRHASASDEGGRGLQLVAAMSQRWGTRQTPEGKTIWAEQTLS
jgi:PAS domain-containing protein/anti-sigma regulatory factor (Ser/Thr protein kinase)